MITTANQNKDQYHKEPVRTQKTRVRPEARENACDQVTAGFSEFSGPITERSEAKPMQSRITFETRLKIALI